MLCEHCKKREATVKYVEVINGVTTSVPSVPPMRTLDSSQLSLRENSR